MAGVEEKRTDQNICTAVGPATVSRTLNTAWRNINKEPLI